MKLFQSATVKLALWYLLILMSVSLLFSAIVIGVARSELDTRLNSPGWRRQLSLKHDEFSVAEQLDLATSNLLVSLAYINLIVLIGGGAGAYLLARHTLAPIEKIHQSQAEFVANASHQLRTPLAIITAETELTLADARASKHEMRANLVSNLEEAKRLNDMTTMLLRLSRLEPTDADQKSEIDLQDMTRRIVSIRNHSRYTITPTPTITITSYPAAVRELLSILIDNAATHSPANSPITIDIARHKHAAVWTITNHGHLSADEIDHIFERFYSGTRTSGYGLGLALANQIAKTLGAEIVATSAESTVHFRVTLPIR